MRLFDFNWFSNMAGYSGNIQADMMDQERESTAGVSDRYLCTECACLTSENNWIANSNCCIDCFNDKENKNGIKS
jgi:hypothetical protein